MWGACLAGCVSLIIIIVTPGVWVVRAVSVTTSERGHLSRGWWPPTSSVTAGVRQHWQLLSQMFTIEVVTFSGDASHRSVLAQPITTSHLTVTTFFCLLDIKNYHVVVKYTRSKPLLFPIVDCTTVIHDLPPRIFWWIFDRKPDINKDKTDLCDVWNSSLLFLLNAFFFSGMPL